MKPLLLYNNNHYHFTGIYSSEIRQVAESDRVYTINNFNSKKRKTHTNNLALLANNKPITTNNSLEFVNPFVINMNFISSSIKFSGYKSESNRYFDISFQFI
ncbi:MAG: hypothetical protein A2046_03370 [Bacteroidetes bacterium GWA2_30_7]|nr:MAG: hypothetical protein A2046_03370 [Bacteroidetes bacterium GWA2_30_7]